MFSNPIELDGIKIRIVEMFPYPEELDGVPVPEPVSDKVVCDNPRSWSGRLQGMIAAVCAEEFVARPSYMGCQRCDYVDLCEVAGKE